MPAVSISLPTELIAKLDAERRWVGRSIALSKVLDYVLSQPGTVRQLCGADKIPEEYKS